MGNYLGKLGILPEGKRVMKLAKRKPHSVPYIVLGMLSLCLASDCFGFTQESASGLSSSQSTSLAEVVSNDERIAELIEQLGQPSYRKRQEAEWSLQQMGLSAFEQLLNATRSPEYSIEIANAARYLIRSQTVVWYLDSDSFQVQNYLKDYDRLESDQRIARIKLLTEHGGNDSILALCRLVRYERTDLLSKAAGVHLLELLSRKQAFETTLMHSIDQALGASRREAAGWLRQLLVDAEQKQADSLAWKRICEVELDVPMPSDQSLATRQRQLILDLHGSAAKWVERFGNRETALNIAKLCIRILNESPHRVSEMTLAFLDDWQMPELVIELSKQYQQNFKDDFELGFLLAESYLKIGDKQKAEELALNTSDSINQFSDGVKVLGRMNSLNRANIIASSRKTRAWHLYNRTLFDWAEREYLRGLQDLIPTPDSKDQNNATDEESNTLHRALEPLDAEIRDALSTFYWEAGRHDEARDILQPLIERLEVPNETPRERVLRQLRLRSIGEDQLLTAYYYYDGLAQLDNEQYAAANAAFLKALSYNDSNPDIVIAMKELAESEQFRTTYEEKFTSMREDLRQEVAKFERNRTNAHSRERRNVTADHLAATCNTLAWLLSKCERDTEDAVSLAERAVALAGEEPAYLDTLARCYFSAGRFDEALATQSKAVSLQPSNRLMVAQLEEFLKKAEDAGENQP